MSEDRHPEGRTPSQTAALVGAIMLAGIFATLAVFLAITWVLGDPTNDLQERQPTDAPASTSSR